MTRPSISVHRRDSISTLTSSSSAKTLSAAMIDRSMTLRDVSEQNLKQAHADYEQLTDFVTKAMGIWMGATPSNPMTAVFKDVQDGIVAMAKQNAGSVFALVEKIAKAQNFQEALTLQARFAQDQTQAYATQTQQLQKLIGEAIQKLQHGSPS
jgi:hypothetical protein